MIPKTIALVFCLLFHGVYHETANGQETIAKDNEYQLNINSVFTKLEGGTLVQKIVTVVGKNGTIIKRVELPVQPVELIG